MQEKEMVSRKKSSRKNAGAAKLKKNYLLNIVLIILLIVVVIFIVKMAVVKSVLKCPLPDFGSTLYPYGGGIISKFCKEINILYAIVYSPPPFTGCTGDNECPGGTVCITALDNQCSAQMSCQECGDDEDCVEGQVCIFCTCA